MSAGGAPGHAGTSLTPSEGGDGEPLDSMLDVAQVEGRVQASSIRKIGDIIDKHPEEAVSIIRSWMYQDQPQS
jgi:flagellar M-ring protein FliF